MTRLFDPLPTAQEILKSAHEALSRGDLLEARNLARRAARRDPASELPWLYMAAAAEDPQRGLAYVAKALEINPRSKQAKKAIRWLIRRLPPRERQDALQRAELPPVRLLPFEALNNRRLISWRIAVPAILLAGVFGAWLGGRPADAREPQSASDPLAKATLTSTPTPTPTHTNTPTPTPTPTATLTPTPTDTPTPRPNISFFYSEIPEELANEGRWIDIDLSDQVVTAYEGVEPVRHFVVSTGTWRTPTVTGQFRVYIKLKSTPMAGPGYYLPGVPWTMYFYKGYALHGTYWHDNFGTPMSHGCVNLTPKEAKWLYDFAEVGTLVNVHP